MTHEFKFKFTNRDQFWGIVGLLNAEWTRGIWTIRGQSVERS